MAPSPTARNLPTRPCDHCRGTGKTLDDVVFGAKMRAARQTLDVTLRAVARQAGWSAAFVSDLERGRRRWSLTAMVKYEAALRREA